MQGDMWFRIGTAVKDIGFPIVIAFFLLFRIEPAMTALTNAVNWSTYVMTEVQKKLDSDTKDRTAMQMEHTQILERLGRHGRDAGASPRP